MAPSRPARNPTDGNTVRTQRTRGRVLAESLRLFNDRGEAHVTTGMIAEALNMSPGNLYYHFRNKDQIIEELFRLFEARIGIEAATPADGATAVEDLWLYLHLMLECIWDFRFLYRNLDDLLGRNRRLRDPFNRMLDRKQETFVELCEWLVLTGAMRAKPEEIRALARNVLVVATYWLNFQSVRGRRQAQTTNDLGLGAYQVMALVAPYLVGAARAHLDRLGRHYLD